MFARCARAPASLLAAPARAIHVEKKLAELGITLPAVTPPVANYKLINSSGKLLFTGDPPLLPLPPRSSRHVCVYV